MPMGYTIPEAAKLTGASQYRIRQMIYAGHLGVVDSAARPYLIPEAELARAFPQSSQVGDEVGELAVQVRALLAEVSALRDQLAQVFRLPTH